MALVQPQVVAIEAPRLHAYPGATALHMPCTYMAAVSKRDEAAVQGATNLAAASRQVLHSDGAIQPEHSASRLSLCPTQASMGSPGR